MTAGPKFTDLILISTDRVTLPGAPVVRDLGTQLRSLVRVAFPTQDASNGVTLEESDDGTSNFTAIAPTIPTGQQDYYINVQSNKRYLRITPVGVAAAVALIDVHAFEGKLRGPQSQAVTVQTVSSCHPN